MFLKYAMRELLKLFMFCRHLYMSYNLHLLYVIVGPIRLLKKKEHLTLYEMKCVFLKLFGFYIYLIPV